MFWSLGHFTSPSIDTILDREAGFTLEELLEEDELLQECKAQNAKLTELCAPSPRCASFFSATSSRPFFQYLRPCACVCAPKKAHTHTKLP